MLRTRAIFLFPIILFGPAVANGQKPIISKVVNAASYATGGRTGKAVALGSIVSIFGENLAQRDESAAGFPLPPTLGGTSVTVQGVSAPLLVVSSRQINIQMPASLRFLPIPDYHDLLVKTAAGTSDPYLIGIRDAFGIFTQD